MGDGDGFSRPESTEAHWRVDMEPYSEIRVPESVVSGIHVSESVFRNPCLESVFLNPYSEIVGSGIREF